MKNNELKPGDLCLIVGFRNSDINLGKTCTVAMLVPKGISVEFNGRTWSPPKEDSCIIAGDTLVNHSARRGFFKDGFSGVAQKYLIKIEDGDPDKQTHTGGVRRGDIVITSSATSPYRTKIPTTA